MTTEKYEVFRVRDLGEYVIELSAERQQQLHKDMSVLIDGLPIGGRLVIDFRDVRFFSPVLMQRIAGSFVKARKHVTQGLFKGRFLAIKDLNPDMKFIVESILREIKGSLYVFDSGEVPGVPQHEEVLNVPTFLRDVLVQIEAAGEPVSCLVISHDVLIKKKTAHGNMSGNFTGEDY